jgi:hypothetical protein
LSQDGHLQACVSLAGGSAAVFQGFAQSGVWTQQEVGGAKWVLQKSGTDLGRVPGEPVANRGAYLPSPYHAPFSLLEDAEWLL